MWSILEKAAGSAQKPVICVFDALDECAKADRSRLIKRLCDFHKKVSASNQATGLKFVVTSRPYDDVRRWFTDTIVECSTIWLRGDEENDTINKEINSVIEGQVHKLAAEFRLEDELRERLQPSLKSMGHRTYLWLHLTLDSIRDQIQDSIDPNKIRIEDLSLPETVEQAYEGLLSRVKDHLRERVRKIFLIIVGARRPFTSREMFLALAVSFPEAGRGPDTKGFVKARFEGQIREWCGLFVFIQGSKLFLIHQTAKEFLLARKASVACTLGGELQVDTRAWRSCLTLAQIEYEMACICIEYLCLRIDVDVLDNAHKVDRITTFYAQLEEARREWELFYVYCADNWNLHLLDNVISPRQPIFRNVLRLYQPQEAEQPLPKWSVFSGRFMETFFPGWLRCMRSSFSIESGQPLVLAQHVMAYSGHTTALRYLSKISEVDWEADDTGGGTALVYATKMGHIETVGFLVDQNANVYYEPRLGVGHLWDAPYAPLQLAVRQGHLRMVESLLRTTSHGDKALKGKQRAIVIAAEGGDVVPLRMLLAAGASLDCDALHAASRQNHIDAVRYLLDVGANVNRLNKHGIAPLECAIQAGCWDIVKILIDAKADVTFSSKGESALHALPSGRCSYDLKSGEDDTSLAQGVQVLLKAGANVNAGGPGGTVLQRASARGWLALVQVLLTAGANVNTSGPCGTALQLASEQGRLNIAQVLVEAGADVNLGGPRGTALQVAWE